MKNFVRPLLWASIPAAAAAIVLLANTGSAHAQASQPKPAAEASAPAVKAKAAIKPLRPAAGIPAVTDAFNAWCSTGNIDPVHGQASCTLFTVPAGRQVVIESISCQAELFAGDGPADVQLIIPTASSTGGPTNVSHLLAFTKQSSGSSVDIWRMTTPLRAYAAAPAGGTTSIGLFFRANPSRPNPQGALCTISGYVAAP